MRESPLYRKVIVAFITLFVFTFIVALLMMFLGDVQHASELMVILLVIPFYAAPFVLLYGIAASMLIEYVFKKKQFKSMFGYVLLGSVSYFLFYEWRGMIYGWVAAFIFAVIDRILSTRKMKDSYIVATIVIPIGLYAIITVGLGLAF